MSQLQISTAPIPSLKRVIRNRHPSVPNHPKLELTGDLRTDFISAARTFLEVRWRHLGRDRTGLDCVGLLVESAKIAGCNYIDETSYRREPVGASFLGIFHRACTRKPLLQKEPGDVLITTDVLYPHHCGIYAIRDGVETIIHAHGRRRRVVEEPLTAFQSDAKIKACYAPYRKE
jgi:hypothetical protein